MFIAGVCVAGVCSGTRSEQDGKGRRWVDGSGSLPSLHIILFNLKLSYLSGTVYFMLHEIPCGKFGSRHHIPAHNLPSKTNKTNCQVHDYCSYLAHLFDTFSSVLFRVISSSFVYLSSALIISYSFLPLFLTKTCLSKRRSAWFFVLVFCCCFAVDVCCIRVFFWWVQCPCSFIASYFVCLRCPLQA